MREVTVRTEEGPAVKWTRKVPVAMRLLLVLLLLEWRTVPVLERRRLGASQVRS